MSTQILVVDDESVTRRVVTYALKPLAVDVLCAENGTQALELANSHTLLLAVVDINLPDIDGFEVIRRLKALPHMQDVPMILFTARSDPNDQHSAAEVGADGFFYKPFSTQELRDLVREHLPQS